MRSVKKVDDLQKKCVVKGQTRTMGGNREFKEELQVQTSI
jgi:hypothetical protein